MNILWFLLSLLTITAEPIRCINFYGLETEHRSPVCDWVHEPEWYLIQLQEAFGLNSVRLPYSREYVVQNNLSRMDQIIATCNQMGIRVILDYHRTYTTHQGATPTEGVSLGQFLDTHISLLNRYKNLIWGVSVFNEIQIADGNYTNRINHMIVNAVESEFPGKYKYFIGCANWGNDCSEITIPPGFEDRVFIDIHQYPFSDDQSTRSMKFPDRINPKNWFVGEIGCKNEEIDWLKDYLMYLKRRNIHNLCFWTIANSWDTGGLWKDDCQTLEQNKIDALVDYFNYSKRGLRNNKK